MSKGLVLPTLSEPLTANSIQTWITNCDDRIELFGTWNPSVSLTDCTKIMCAAVAFDPASVKLGSFWGSERESCLGSTWDSFKGRIKSQFLGTDSKVDALQSFALQTQGRRPFAEFLASMQAACSTLNAYGKSSPFYVSDFLMKSSLLFRCHPTLRLRVQAIPSFSLESTALDSFIATLSNSWAAIVAEPSFTGVSTLSAPSASALSYPPVSPTVASRPITATEREVIKSKGGCYNCGRSPKDPDWKTHGGTPYSRHCPGNPDRGIPSCGVVAALFPADRADDVLSFFGFVDCPDAPADSRTPALASVAAVTSGLPVVHTASGSDVFDGFLPSVTPIAAVMTSYGVDYDNDEEIDDNEDDLFFGSDYTGP
ncbi:hypothetical protein K435DRAFT_803828 [Dendrothele bispora CBS 962.96]|uniref:Retrotransposon gag domain-containing protein n=1 Tax=Dendrothele bispora (strain CBS 962.96) TaxID=1314807 RepID=A0A4S8LGK4_DENBC|nr:hypothetical protein K435DRAFT_803828 [Dendrothele bispora CBS 962.96]